MRPLQISPDTAVKLSQFMKVPVEHLMHMPQHILMQKLAEMAKQGSPTQAGNNDEPAPDRAPDNKP
jgi:hypothetical protein